MYKTLSLPDNNDTPYQLDVSNFDKAILTKIARLFVYAAIICLPFSHAFVNQFIFIAVIFSILSGKWRWKLQILKPYLSIWIGIVLLIVLAITLFHPHVSWHNATTSYFKYTKILYIPLLLPLFLQAQSRQQAITCFIASVVVGAVISTLLHGLFIHYPNIHLSWPKHIDISGAFVNIISFSVLTAYAIYLLLIKCIDSSANRLPNLILATFLGIHLFFVNGEKTGAILFSLLMILLLWQQLHWRGLIIALVAIPLILIPSYLFSDLFHTKVHEFCNYFYSVATHGQTNETSTAYRVDFAKYSFRIFTENPILGVGIGGFKQAYLDANGPLLPGTQYLGDPHNSYIYILVEAGLVGLLVYLLWIISLWVFALRVGKGKSAQYCLQALLLAFTVNGITNTSITGNTTGMLYVIFIAVFFAALAPRLFKA